jgi:hypothetical protein
MPIANCPAEAQSYDFLTNGIQSAKVVQQGGVPTLVINGQPVPPLMFVYQGLRSDPLLYWRSEAPLAAAHGIHIYGIQITYFPWDQGNTGVPRDYSSADATINSYLQADPQAVFLLRIGVWPTNWVPSVAPAAGDNITYYDGTTFSSNPSIGSDIYFNGFVLGAQELIQHYEASSLARHILGYTIMGQNSGEWFPFNYVTNGPDYSATNLAAFRTWLTDKYGSDSALSQAWGRTVTLATASIPLIAASRLPLSGVPVGSPLIAFYQMPAEQDWIDFSQYTSDIFSQRLLDIAQTFRTATQGKRLIGFYNGYTFDLAASFNGHLRIDRLLASPNIDYICSPISYLPNTERNAGGTAGAMSARDSIALHGKLQLAEDDLRTYLGQQAGLPDLGYNGNLPTSGLNETIGVLRRNFSAAMVHRAGTWWMDLNENGAFNDTRFWQVMADGLGYYGNLLATPKPYRPEVALIVDPPSIAYEKDDNDLIVGARALLRNVMGRTG